ncbi:hypothetical protein VT52_003465 [Streptomyces malaysiense]|uniref:Integral membrane protein n=1 Tax=Streptomyces malaysiense TaxID=1428626 RepID=A0A1J4Q9T2_9ACTN|nr:hypothetical protein VT52_003465 [Streptomyces malaysiense]
MRRVLERIARLVLTYVVLYAVTWVVIGLTLRGDYSFTEDTGLGSGMFVIVGGPTLLLALLAGPAHTQMDVTTFRAALAFPMVFFAWPLVGAGAPEPLVFQVLCQIAFAAYLMPAPLVPENWTPKPR